MHFSKVWQPLLRLALGSPATAGRQPRRRPPGRRLCLEPLEDRNLLSSYNLTVIGPGEPNVPNAINNASVVQVVGQNANLHQHAYLWDSVHGQQDLGTVGSDLSSEAYGINDSGQVVGWSFTFTSNYEFGSTLTSEHAFLWPGSRGMQNIGKGDLASGINSAGEVCGTLNYDQSGETAGLWNGKWTSPAGVPPRLAGINNYGQVCGTSNVSSSVQQAFLWTPATAGGTTGTLQNLGTLGGASAGANALNGQGSVTGSAALPGGNLYHAFVWRPASANGTSGTLTDLDPGGTGNSSGQCINSGGLVAGYSDDHNPAGKNYAVMWQPGANGYTMSNLNSVIPRGHRLEPRVCHGPQ
jgi:probable HAF family extracellular repeat protein